MKLARNEKGVTLIEVLAAVVILSIVLVSLMNFFPQMSLINKVNSEKSQAINTAKQILIDWKNDKGVEDFLKGDSSAILPAAVDHSDINYYYYRIIRGNYDVNIKIAKNPPQNFPSGPSLVRFIQVQLLNKQNTVVSETYGYIILE